jgi:hypothetical protein
MTDGIGQIHFREGFSIPTHCIIRPLAQVSDGKCGVIACRAILPKARDGDSYIIAGLNGDTTMFCESCWKRFVIVSTLPHGTQQ